jgi:hypothetical protein
MQTSYIGLKLIQGLTFGAHIGERVLMRSQRSKCQFLSLRK